MADAPRSDAHEPGSKDLAPTEIARLLGLVKRLEYENTWLRRELAAARPLAA
jgi:hypothetical protein